MHVPATVAQGMDRVLGGDGGEGDDLPVAALQHVADEVVLVQPLHDDHHRPAGLVIETGDQGVIEEVVDPPPRRFREGVQALQRVIDDDDVRTATEDCAAHARGEAGAEAQGAKLQIPEPGHLGVGE